MAIGAISSASFPPGLQQTTQRATQQTGQPEERERTSGSRATGEEQTRAAPASPGNPNLNLSEAELKQVESLKKRDREVRAHEAAHAAAAGSLAQGGPTFDFQYGPDGQAYAVGGEVNIDTSPGQTPEETIQKAKQIRAAALAPAEPSSQDRAVAAEAARLEAQAQQELAAKARENDKTDGKQDSAAGSSTSEDAAANVNSRAIALYGAIAESATPGTQIRTQA